MPSTDALKALWECLDSGSEPPEDVIREPLGREIGPFPVQDVAPVSPSLCSPAHHPDAPEPILLHTAPYPEVPHTSTTSVTHQPSHAGIPQGSEASPAVAMATPEAVREEMATLEAVREEALPPRSAHRRRLWMDDTTDQSYVAGASRLAPRRLDNELQHLQTLLTKLLDAAAALPSRRSSSKQVTRQHTCCMSATFPPSQFPANAGETVRGTCASRRYGSIPLHPK